MTFYISGVLPWSWERGVSLNRQLNRSLKPLFCSRNQQFLLPFITSWLNLFTVNLSVSIQSFKITRYPTPARPTPTFPKLWQNGVWLILMQPLLPNGISPVKTEVQYDMISVELKKAAKVLGNVKHFRSRCRKSSMFLLFNSRFAFQTILVLVSMAEPLLSKVFFEIQTRRLQAGLSPWLQKKSSSSNCDFSVMQITYQSTEF